MRSDELALRRHEQSEGNTSAEGQPVVIERASERVLGEIIELERASFSDPWSEASFTSVVNEPAAFFATARDGASDHVAGYVVAWFMADEGEIANLAVREPKRRRGVGAALLDAALDEGRRRGATAIYLEVRDSNAAARALYASRNFEEVGRRRKYYRKPVEDAIVLRRSMPDPS
jgi:ribosomal-protein-alanine N-acetyltransferase